MRSNSQSGPGLAPIQQHHHHSMGLSGPQQPLPPHPSMPRPGIDRAHTFPTPPTSASGVGMAGGMGASEGFQWQSQGMNGSQATNPMSIDTGLSNARSMPATPASTPPGNAIQGMQQYHPGAQAYDNNRAMYNPPSQQSPYQTTNAASQDRGMYAHHDAYGKNDMGPPSARPATGTGPDQKPSNGIMSHGDPASQPVTHASGEEEGEHEHDGGEYTHDSAYDANRASYNYAAPAVGTMSNEHQHISPEMTGSPNHPPASGRATPRTTGPQPYYSQPTTYTTSPRMHHQPSSNLYSVMSNDRGANGATGNDVYAPAADMNSMSNGYSTQASVMNSSTGGIKRGREDDDDLQRPVGGDPGMDIKRRKTLIDATVPAGTYDAMARSGPAAVASVRRR